MSSSLLIETVIMDASVPVVLSADFGRNTLAFMKTCMFWPGLCELELDLEFNLLDR